MDTLEKDTTLQELQSPNDTSSTKETEQDLESMVWQENVAEITNLKGQVEILQEKLLRTVAEAENTRKRLEKTITDTRDYAIVAFAKDLLTVNDNLSRALEHMLKDIRDDEVASIITGVEMTRSDLVNILKKHGLESIEPIPGEKFDYNIHHAISQIVSNEHEQDTIIAVMQVGYKIKDRLLRPAIVQVAKLPAQ
ncbi:nucleotide exchange factor GrpE [Candidatus Tisiphia endosymbiont of Nemotelus uliginosus]|uniref:nucleotide exchange factor GrpE n=1 Tax=Candidatus Tisiphia endosymbiont of Nemotelus uliginosus TaxID=3077926 RepID=UPI0035C8C238